MGEDLGGADLRRDLFSWDSTPAPGQPAGALSAAPPTPAAPGGAPLACALTQGRPRGHARCDMRTQKARRGRPQLLGLRQKA